MTSIKGTSTGAYERTRKEYERKKLKKERELIHGVLQYDFVVNSGAEKIGCSPETIKRYLKKLTSKAGAYEWLERDELYLKLKDKYRET